MLAYFYALSWMTMSDVNPIKQVNPWNISAENPVYVSYSDNILEDKANIYESHTKPHFAIRFLLDGEGSVQIDFQNFEIKANSLALIIPSQIVTIDIPKGAKVPGYFIAFNADMLKGYSNKLEIDQILGSIGDSKFLHLQDVETIKRIKQVFELILAEYRDSQTLHKNDILQNLIHVILLEIIRSRDPFGKKINTRSHEQFRNFIHLLNVKMNEMHQVQEYAEALFITTKTLNRICKKVTGKPTLVLIHKRLNLEAKRNIVFTKNTIKEIAFQLGFMDDSHFSKFFIKMNNLTPLQYRQRDS